jgi:hypothetical protein
MTQRRDKKKMLTPAERAEDLLGKMTVEEKAMQPPVCTRSIGSKYVKCYNNI